MRATFGPLATTRGMLYAVNPDLTENRHFPAAGAMEGAPAYARGIVYFSDDRDSPFRYQVRATRWRPVGW